MVCMVITDDVTAGILKNGMAVMGSVQRSRDQLQGSGRRQRVSHTIAM